MDIPKIINGGKSFDDRGCVSFVNDFNFSDVKRFYQVSNHDKNYIRAWHGHRKEGKYVFVSNGAALVGAVNLDEVYGEVYKFVLSSEKPQILWIPPGYANGFMNLLDNTIIQFFSTSTLEDSKGDDTRFAYNKWDIWHKDYR